MIIGTGIDIVSVRRIKETETRWGQKFLDRIFTERELRYSFGHKTPHIHLAARFACKEAVMKAIGTGLRNGVAWKDIEVVNKDSGKPDIILHRKTKDIAGSIGVRVIHVSIAHDDGFAIAQVIMEGVS